MTIPQASQSCPVPLKCGYKSKAVHSTVQLRWAVRPRMNNRTPDHTNKQICVSLTLFTILELKDVTVS